MTNSDDSPASDNLNHHVVEARASGAALPFEGLEPPAPLTTDPPTAARWLAFGSILVGGLLGGMIGYGTADVMGGSELVVGLSAVLGAAIGAIGVGVVAGLTLRAMNEWHTVRHPEAEEPESPGRTWRRHARRSES